MRRRRWPHGVPLLVLAGLCAALAWEVRRQLDETHVPAVAEAKMASPARNPDSEPARITPPDYRAPPVGAFDEVVARNLFSTKRQPPPLDDAPADGDVQAGALELVLSGVVIADEHRVAILNDPAGQQVIRLAPGETHAGWRLVDLDARSATFRRGAEESRLTLTFAPDSRRPAAREPRRRSGDARNPQQARGESGAGAGATVEPRRTDREDAQGERGLHNQSIRERIRNARD